MNFVRTEKESNIILIEHYIENRDVDVDVDVLKSDLDFHREDIEKGKSIEIQKNLDIDIAIDIASLGLDKDTTINLLKSY